METTRAISSIILLLFFAVSYIGATPIQTHGETIGLNDGVYMSPELAEALARSYAALDEAENYIRTGIHSHHEKLRRGLDSLSGGTFGENKRFGSLSNTDTIKLHEGSEKRNMDEIDRTGFDSFLKRNFDEIDHSGWDNFVKRRIFAAKQQ